MAEEICDIKNIIFSLISDEDIERISVCEINNTKKKGQNSVYDCRMGATDNMDCITCNLKSINCAGHFGHIKLTEPILHPLFYSRIESFLKCICFYCGNLIIDDQLILNKGESRFQKILSYVKKEGIKCFYCLYNQPLIKIEDGFVYVDNTLIYTKDIISALLSVPDEIINKLGVIIPPKDYIISKLLILPPVCRPYIKNDEMVCDDDLTIQYLEIIKNNNYYNEVAEKYPNPPQKNKFLSALIFRIFTLFNNNKQKARHTTNSRPIKSIFERLSGKEGQIRNNALGKRSEQTARTVISPDPTLKFDEMILPEEIAVNLSFPEKITPLNYDKIDRLINIEKKVKYIIKKNGIEFDVQRYIKEKGKFTIAVGETAYRQLQDGDILLLNRFPTLHRNSMLAMKIKIKPCKTIKFNLALCQGFNSDFDGDEMNISVPGSYESLAELSELAMSKNHIISASTSKNIVNICQDSILAAYKMTKSLEKIEDYHFYDIVCRTNISDARANIQRIRRVLKKNGKKASAFNGAGLISFILPSDFFYDFYKTNIKEGVIIDGVLNKLTLGSSYNSIIQILFKEYPKDISTSFIDNIQFITHGWLSIFGFTINLSDCVIKDNSIKKNIQDLVLKGSLEVENLEEMETKITLLLNNLKDNALKIARGGFRENNNFIDTIESGSKGNYINITQIAGLVGQQNFKNSRIQKTINNGSRSITHYPFNKSSYEKIEERGFISSSYIDGLNPKEFFFHCITGREGVSDTAVKTAVTGYVQRRLIKACENLQICYDNTVRSTNNTEIFQPIYNGTGLDPTKAVMVNGQPSFCNINRIIQNLEFHHK